MRSTFIASLLFLTNICFGQFKSEDGPWYAARVRDIAVGYADGLSVIYAVNAGDYSLTPRGTLVKSTDGGDTWHEIQAIQNGYSVATRRDNPQIVLVSANGDLLRSIDGGTNWTVVYAGFTASRIAFSRTNPNTVLAGSRVPFNGHSVHVSTDGGVTWTWDPTFAYLANITSIVFHPTFPSCYISGVNYSAQSPSGIWVGAPLAGWGPLLPPDIPNPKIAAFALQESNPQVLYAGTISPYGEQMQGEALYESQPPRVYKSTNAGSDWSTVGNFYASGITIDPNNSMDIIVSSDQGIMRSMNGGNSWFESNSGAVDRNILTLTSDASRGGKILGGALHSFCRSDNGGATWTEKTKGMRKAPVTAVTFHNGRGVACAGRLKYEGFLDSWIGTIHRRQSQADRWLITFANSSPEGGDAYYWNDIMSHPDRSTTIYSVGSYGEFQGSVFKSTDDGVTWSLSFRYDQNTDLTSIDFDATDPEVAFVGGYDFSTSFFESFILKTINSGHDWEVLDPGLREIRSLIIDPATTGSNRVIYVGGSSIRKSTDDGATWYDANAGAGEARTLAIDPVHPKVLYGGNANGVYRTVDGGERWQEINNGILYRNITSLLVHPNTPEIVYASSVEGEILDPIQAHVYKTTNGGQQWSEVSGSEGLPEHAIVYKLRFDDASANTVYAATDSGVYSIPHEWSGTLAANTTWRNGETYLVQGKLTVPQGVTLDIRPGAIVQFASGAGLIVDGTLHADAAQFGIQQGSPDRWYGIVLRNSSSSSINGCTISQAQYGVGLVSTTGEPQHPRITGCAITDCDVGIYVWGATEWDQQQSIFGNNIEGCTFGVVTNQGDTKCAPGFKSNIIRHSGRKGMWIERSRPMFLDNLIEMSNEEGVTCRFDGDAQFGVVAHLTPPEYNTIRNNNAVQVSAMFASPLLGLVWDESSCELISGGLNRVYHGNDNTARVYAYGPGTVVQADKCFWGWPVLASWFIEENKAQIIHRCPLKPEATSEEEMLAEAATLRAQGEYQQAISLYEDIVEHHGASDEASAAVTGLVQAYDEYAQHSGDTTAQAAVEAYLEEQAENHTNADVKTIAQLELARTYEQKQGWSEALGIYNSLLQESSDTQLKSVVFRAMVNLYAGRLGDFDHAHDVLDRMEHANLNSEHIEMAKLDVALFSGELLTLHGLGKTGASNGGIVGSDVPTRYSLEQNFPNPFNPTTEIWFKLGGDGNMSLKLYDLLGREIRTLAEGYHEQGYYNVKLDATDLASGVYFYRLTTPAFVSVKKLIVTK
jgi:photosystem II stability/assembly factor-like uncharacterized protein/tetratricopeptide (TPR) repeat protein